MTSPTKEPFSPGMHLPKPYGIWICASEVFNLRKTDFYRGRPAGSDNFTPGYKPSGVLINLLASQSC